MPSFQNPNFQRFIERYGRKKLAHDLGICTQTVFFWVHGKTSPRMPVARKIVALSKRRLTIGEIYNTRYPNQSRKKSRAK